jgi:hypothetical protein
MSRWFRHYAGMMRDEKLVSAALKAKQPIERVIWVWGAILESAAEINNGGRYDLDAAEAAHFLHAGEDDVLSIFAALEAGGRVLGGSVVKWGDRQFQSDNSAGRQKRYREKQKGGVQGDGERHVEGVHRNGDDEVTASSRHGDAPETETETETEAEKKEERTREVALAPADDWPSDYREMFWSKYPNKVGKPDALKKLDRVRKTAGVPWAELWGGLERYVGKTDDRPWCNPATWIHQQRWTDQPASGPQNGQSQQNRNGGGQSGERRTFATIALERARAAGLHD